MHYILLLYSIIKREGERLESREHKLFDLIYKDKQFVWTIIKLYLEFENQEQKIRMRVNFKKNVKSNQCLRAGAGKQINIYLELKIRSN